MADSLDYEARAAEITGRIVVAMVTPGGSSSSSWLYEKEDAKKYGAGAGAFFEEVFKSVLASLSPDHELVNRKG